MSVWAVLACRARSERLYCKPLQQIARRPILAHIVANIRRIPAVHGIVLAIADGRENECFVDFAARHDLPFVRGPEENVLARILPALDQFGIATMFRVTTECPFLFADGAEGIIAEHVRADRDFTTILNLPLGTTYELLGRRVLEAMAATGNPRYRAALSVYVREHADRLSIATLLPPPECRRPDIHLAVDHPGQLIFCQRAFESTAAPDGSVDVRRLIRYYDSNPVMTGLLTSIHEDVFALKPDQTVARVWE